MYASAFDYVRVSSWAEAVAQLQELGDEAHVIAGGQSLVPMMMLHYAVPSALIDIGGVDERTIELADDGSLVLSALVRHVDLQHSDVVARHTPMLTQAVRQIGNVRVRQRGTIGGSLAHGDAASDLPAAMLITEAEVTVQGPDGQRSVAAADLFKGYMTTDVGAQEVLTEIRIPTMDGWGYGHQKFNRRSEDWAMVGVCAVVKAADGVCEDVRIGLTHMGSVPLRATAAEEALRGQELSAENIAKAAEQAAEGTNPPSDLNASTDYKRHLARVLTRRAIADAVGGG